MSKWMFFYVGLSEKKKQWVQIFGVLIFLWPFCLLMFYNSWPYVRDSWGVYEKSIDSSGLPGVFIIKTLLIVYPALLFLMGLVLIHRAYKVLRGENG